MASTTPDPIGFAMAHLRWMAKNEPGRTTPPGGFTHGIDQSVANDITAKLHLYVEQCVKNGSIPPNWQPANDFQARRVAKAYTDRGLKAA